MQNTVFYKHLRTNSNLIISIKKPQNRLQEEIHKVRPRHVDTEGHC